jgi:hypothetical protein
MQIILSSHGTLGSGNGPTGPGGGLQRLKAILLALLVTASAIGLLIAAVVLGSVIAALLLILVAVVIVIAIVRIALRRSRIRAGRPVPNK